MMQYENRIVCFLDILGFGAITQASINGAGDEIEDKSKRILDALDAIRDVLDIDKGQQTPTKRITQFSDSIVISFPETEPSEVFHTLEEILWLTMELVKHGMVCRGGVTNGKIHHSETQVFGPAVVAAYKIEKYISIYPRIVVDSSVIDIGANNSEYHNADDEREYIMNCLRKDEDGHYYVEYYLQGREELDEPETEFPIYMSYLREIIVAGLSHDDTKIKRKYRWMRRKYNEVAGLCRRKKFLKKLSGDSDLYDAYASIADIAYN
jgi:hypothetical protein